jgi:hypothetical protein
MAKDEKQKEKHATNQFFRSLLGYIASVLVKTTELSDHEIRLRAMEEMMNSIKSVGDKK